MSMQITENTSLQKEKINVSEFVKKAVEKIIEVETAVKSGVRDKKLNDRVNDAIKTIEDLAKKLKVTDEDIKTRGTEMMKHVYEEFKDSKAVVEDLRKGVVNKLKTMMVTRVLKAAPPQMGTTATASVRPLGYSL
jgi:adenine C2-methylase RlmN of 23S rRNA A2503 and tRNA A37